MYPESFMQVIPKKHQDLFCQISKITEKDIQNLTQCLENLGVTVRLPNFDSVDLYLDDKDNLIKPPITPRDWALTLNDQLYIIPQYLNQITGFENVIEHYRNHNQKVSVLDRSCDPMCYLIFPSVVRVGKDIFVDISTADLEIVRPVLQEWARNYRVHISHTGDHTDAVFCPIAPGQIFSSHYREKYSDTFPGWQVFWLHDTTQKRRYNGYNGKWWVPGFDYAHFNNFVFDIGRDWIGDARETVFEVNMLVVDDKNVICIAEDDAACKAMEKLGITPHVIDFKARGFWDGGIHCVTCDIYREGPIVDFWSGRGDAGIFYY